MAFDSIAVIGAGAWGTALALTCARAGRKVTLWEHDAANAENLKKKRESLFLPGVRIPDDILIAPDLSTAARAQAVLLVVPAQAVRSAAQKLAPLVASGTPVIVCAKGIERGSKQFVTDVLAACAPKIVPAILSGSSFAVDVARGLPTAVTLAARDGALAEQLAHAIGSANFRPYHATDVRGVEIGGAAKNVLAIGAGIVAGRALGASAAAALVTRGFRAGALRPRLWRQAGDADGPVRARRFVTDLLEPTIAQFLVRHGARSRPASERHPRRLGRRRVHRAGALGHGTRKKRRHADLGRGCRGAERTNERRRGDRIALDAAIAGGGVKKWRTGC